TLNAASETRYHLLMALIAQPYAIIRDESFNYSRSRSKVERKQERLIWLAAAVCGALLLAACGSASESAADNTVAATVNAKKIMTAEVERLIQQQSQGK